MSIGMLLIAIELLHDALHPALRAARLAGPCFIGFAIGESLGAAALRIAGGIFTKIADIGADLMKIVFNIKEDDARNPGVIADCTGDNAGDSVGPTADGFETYGVTGVALITFILLAVTEPDRPGAAAGLDLRHARHDGDHQRRLATSINDVDRRRPATATPTNFNFEHPLTSLVWITSIVSIVVTYRRLATCSSRTWRRRHASGGSCRRSSPAARSPARIIPEVIKIFTSTESRHVREVVTVVREGGASLNILSGLVAGNFSRLLDRA